MSVPAVGWAIERGRALDLTNNERLVLIVLADRANGARVCWPSLKCIASDTGLVERTVFSVVHRLQEVGVIEIERRGRGQAYKILRPADEGEPTQPLHRSKRANGASRPRASVQPLHQSEPGSTQPLHQLPVDNSPRPMQSTQRPMQMTAKTNATIANEPRKNQEEPKTREASDKPSDVGVSGSPADIEPVISAAQRFEAQTRLAKLRQALGHREYAPGRAPALTPQEQIAAAQPAATVFAMDPRLADHIRAARRDLAERAAQRMAVHA